MSNIIFSQTPSTYDCIVYPDGDSSTGLSIYPVSPTTHFDKVDDLSTAPNDDTDYVFSNSPTTALDMFNLSAHPVEATGTINYIQMVSRAKSHLAQQSSSGEYKHKINESHQTRILALETEVKRLRDQLDFKDFDITKEH